MRSIFYCLLLSFLLIRQIESLPEQHDYANDEEHDSGSIDTSDNAPEASQENSAHPDDGGGGADEHQPPVVPEVQDAPPTAEPAAPAEGGEPAEEQPAEPITTTASPCHFDDLVKCLTAPLDEWALALYSMKENIVAISGSECLGARELMRKCIEEKSTEYQCDHANILAVAARVTDLLVHKKGSGNWLRSYYVTAFVCTKEGGELRDQIPESCLKQEHIGSMTFQALQYMDDQLSKNHTANGRERCEFLKTQSLFLRNIAVDKCKNNRPTEAGQLMCETIKMAFLKMHPEMFNGEHKCEFQCVEEQKPPTATGENGAQPGGGGGGDETSGKTGGVGGQNGPATGDQPTQDGNGSRRRKNNLLLIFLASTTTAVFDRYFKRILL